MIFYDFYLFILSISCTNVLYMYLSIILCRYDFVFSAIRDFYEAYAVYTFIALLIAIMEDGQGLPELLSKVLHCIIITMIKLCMHTLLLYYYVYIIEDIQSFVTYNLHP